MRKYAEAIGQSLGIVGPTVDRVTRVDGDRLVVSGVDEDDLFRTVDLDVPQLVDGRVRQGYVSRFSIDPVWDGGRVEFSPSYGAQGRVLIIKRPGKNGWVERLSGRNVQMADSSAGYGNGKHVQAAAAEWLRVVEARNQALQSLGLESAGDDGIKQGPYAALLKHAGGRRAPGVLAAAVHSLPIEASPREEFPYKNRWGWW